MSGRIVTDILFGIDADDIEEIMELIDALFGRKLEGREGLAYGEYYCFGVFDKFMRLQFNKVADYMPEIDTPEEPFFDPDFQEYPILLYINDADKYPHYLAAIECQPNMFVKLRTKRWEDD